MHPITLGDLEIHRVIESESPTSPRFLFPDATRAFFAPHTEWLAPHFYDAASDRLLMSIHAFVVRSPRWTALVDACVGNGKPRANPFWNGLNTPFLERLAAVGVHPAGVDYVLCTHLHVDHVGWCTEWREGRWRPTFPRARYIFHAAEFAFWEREAAQGGEQAAAFADSVLPVVEAGQAELVAGDWELEHGLRLEPTPGHTPGHCSVRVRGGAQGQEAVISGDMLHHPVQIGEWQLSSRFCVDPQQASQTRRQSLERWSEEGVQLLGTHFATPTCGRVIAPGGHFRFRF